MKQPLISIIMPVRNGIPYLSECIESIINQTHQNWELLVTNDHSDDGTWDVLQEYNKKDARIIPLQNKKPGIIPALQTSYNASCGDFITRMDADDIMPSQKLSTLLHALKSSNTDIATGKVKYFSDAKVNDGYRRYESWLNNLVDNGNHFSEIYKECVIPSPCWMMSRERFDKIGGFDSEIYPEDYDLVFRMYEGNCSITAVYETLHLWRDHAGRASRNDDNYSDNRFLNIKLHYFLKCDYNSQMPLIIWGAGKKGKHVARHLIEKRIPFTWITDNQKKLSVPIYDVQLAAEDTLDSFSECIIIGTVANDDEQAAIKRKIESLNLGELSFWIC